MATLHERDVWLNGLSHPLLPALRHPDAQDALQLYVENDGRNLYGSRKDDLYLHRLPEYKDRRGRQTARARAQLRLHSLQRRQTLQTLLALLGEYL